MLKQRERKEALDRAEIHSVLSNDRRWHVLELLAEEECWDLRSLADEIATLESDASRAPRELRQSVYVTLHQNHLPKLDSLGIVEYDDTAKTVQLDDRARELDVYLEVVEPGHLSWSEYYLGVVALGLLATVASATGTPALAAVAPVAYAVSTLVVLLASVLAQMRAEGSPWLDRLTDE